MTGRRSAPRVQDRDSGAAAVEFAMVLPFLMLILFGIMEFGLAFNTQIALTQAAREGVRLEALDIPGAAGATEDSFLCLRCDVAELTVIVEECPNGADRARVRATYNYTPLVLPDLDFDLAGEAVMRCGG